MKPDHPPVSRSRPWPDFLVEWALSRGVTWLPRTQDDIARLIFDGECAFTGALVSVWNSGSSDYRHRCHDLPLELYHHKNMRSENKQNGSFLSERWQRLVTPVIREPPRILSHPFINLFVLYINTLATLTAAAHLWKTKKCLSYIQWLPAFF